jgi:DNA helicase-2/ATP-dependent DNA helicase PcrA
VRKEGIKFNDIAILYRNNYFSGRIEQELITQKIPYEILGSFKFIEREEIKDILSFLKAVIYKENVSITRILSMQENVGSRTVEKIERQSNLDGKKIYEYLLSLIENNLEIENISGKKAKEKIIEVIKNINYFEKKLGENLPLSNFLIGILNKFEYIKHLETKNNINDRKKHIKQFLIIIQN